MYKLRHWYRQPQYCRVQLQKQFAFQRLWNWSEIDRIPISFWKKSVSFYLNWHIFQAVHCTGWNNCSKVKQTPSRIDVLFLMSVFRFYPGLKLSFGNHSVGKSLFLTACFFWHFRLYLSCTKNLKFLEPFVLLTRTWSSYFVFSKHLDSIQYYMMLLEQSGHIVVKVQVTVTWLGEDQIHVCLVT